MNVNLTVLSSISCFFFMLHCLLMSKNRKLFWGFSFQREQLFLQQFFVMLEMSKDGMTMFLLMVMKIKIKIMS